MDNLRLHQILRLLFVLTLMICGGLFLIFSWYLLYPFLIAFLIAWFLQPFIRLLEVRIRIPKTLAIFLLLLLLFSFISSIITLILAEFMKGIHYLSDGIPVHYQQLVNHLLERTTELIFLAMERIEHLVGITNVKQKIIEFLKIIKEQINDTGVEVISSVLEMITRVLASVPSSLTTILIGTLATFFICKDWDLIIDTTSRSTPDHIQVKIKQILKDLKKMARAILKAQIILMIVSMSIIFIGLSIINIPNALTITVIATLVDLIPYIGTGVIFIPWIAYQFLSGEFITTIGLSVIYMVVLLTRQFLEPKLLAIHFGVPPVVLLISLFIGFQILGVLGMIISPIIIAFIRTLHNSGITRFTWKFIKGSS